MTAIPIPPSLWRGGLLAGWEWLCYAVPIPPSAGGVGMLAGPHCGTLLFRGFIFGVPRILRAAALATLIHVASSVQLVLDELPRVTILMLTRFVILDLPSECCP